MKKIKVLFFFYTLIIIFLSGCGGGGSSNSETDTYNYDNVSRNISYVGNTELASISATNAGRLVESFFTRNSAYNSSIAFKQNQQQLPAKLNFKHIYTLINQKIQTGLNIHLSNNNRNDNLSYKQDVNTNELCQIGNVDITGTLYQDYTAHFEFNYHNCNDNNEILDGKIIIKYPLYDEMSPFQDYDLYIPQLNVVGSYGNISMAGKIHYSRSEPAIDNYLVDLVIRDNLDNHFTQLDHLSVADEFDINGNIGDYFAETISGRYYDSDLGALDITTETALTYDSIDTIFPNKGQMFLSGINGSKIRVTSTTFSLANLRIALDINGDGVFEQEGVMHWSDLGTPIAEDLADDDQDGMHNSWEQAYGLNAIDPADAIADTDNDFFTALEEYQNGSNPENTDSVPIIADLKITRFQTNEVFINHEYDYELLVTNVGPDTAYNVTLKETVDPGLSIQWAGELIFSNAHDGGWECNHSQGVVTCNTPYLMAGYYGGVQVHVIASAEEATVVSTASASSDVFDQLPSDNRSELTTQIVQPYADLELSYETWFKSDSYSAEGIEFIHHIDVINLGPGEVSRLSTVTITVPDGAEVISDSGSFACTHNINGKVTCYIDTMAANHTYGIDISFAVNSAAGYVTSSATVDSGVPDPDLSNNQAEFSTYVGAATTAIQAQIDSAASGDVVKIPPGYYLGALDLQGKDIALTSLNSTDPAVLYGVNAGYDNYAVNAGPNGAVNHLKFTGPNGILVSGSGTKISENIFDGHQSRGFAIFGNGASPEINRNLITNYVCLPNSYGLVRFSNSSSPLITNNLFVDNYSTAISMVLPDGYTPRVINNTLVNNELAILMSAHQLGQVYRNNIFAFNGIAIQDDYPDDIENLIWENNLLFGNTINYDGLSDQTSINGNLAAIDPLFANASNGDYRLLSGSPGIDAGSSQDAPTSDYMGAVRPLDGDGDSIPVIDIGALEASAL